LAVWPDGALFIVRVNDCRAVVVIGHRRFDDVESEERRVLFGNRRNDQRVGRAEEDVAQLLLVIDGVWVLAGRGGGG